MDKHVTEHLDQQRWLMNSGLLTPAAQDNIYTYGFISHPRVENVLVTVDVKAKKISYRIYLPTKAYKKVILFDKYRKSQSVIDLFLLRRLIKKEGNLDIRSILSRFIKDYCGPSWSVEVSVLDTKEYIDEQPTDAVEGTAG